MWNLKQQARATNKLGISGFVSLLMSLALACGSSPPAAPPAPEPTPSPTAAPALTATAAPLPAAATSPSVPTLPLPSVSDVADRVKDSVVAITLESVSQGLFFSFQDVGAGTGIIIRPDGYILTNFHLVQTATKINVLLPNGETHPARVVGQDVVTDLAVLKIDVSGLAVVTFGDSNRLRVGEWVVALGNALALKGGPSVTIGIVSALGRTVNTERGQQFGLIQTDAAINEGNSGGPLVNLKGEVIGLNSVILAQARGIGFAIGSSVAQTIADSLIEKGRVLRPLIGLLGDDMTPSYASRLNLPVREGVIVTQLSRDGPAYAAGLRVGDVITKIDDIPTPDLAHFLTLLWTYKAGDKIQVQYYSGSRSLTTVVELTERAG